MAGRENEAGLKRLTGLFTLAGATGPSQLHFLYLLIWNSQLEGPDRSVKAELLSCQRTEA